MAGLADLTCQRQPVDPLRRWGHGHRFSIGCSLAASFSFVAGSACAQEQRQPTIMPLRFDEDWRQLCTHEGTRAFPDSLKCLPIGSDTTLTLGGEWRERFETVSNPGFGLVQDSDTVLLHRGLLHADLRFAETARVFVQLGAFGYNGRDGARQPFDLDRFDIVQGFVDLSAPVVTGHATLRIGRQELSFGSSRLVGVREGPNVRRAFDGVRGFWANKRYRVDAFYARPVNVTPDVFGDGTSNSEAFWGIYGTGGVAGPLKADIYYLGLHRNQARFAGGSGDESRHSLGVRLFGNRSGFDWDWEGVIQFGHLGSKRINAWTIATDTGFTWTNAPLRPRVGLKADIASGDSDPADGSVGTFNALYPKLPYFSEASLIAPANIVDLHPSLRIQPISSLRLQAGWNFLWRHRIGDAIYSPPLAPIAGSAVAHGRFIGQQMIFNAEWRATPNITIASEYVHFERGAALRSAGGRNVDFVFVSASYKF